MPFPPIVHHELEGWVLFWAELTPQPGPAEALAEARREAAARARASLTVEKLAAHPAAAAVRKLFRAAGCDPTRYRPAAEALLRRVLKGDELPAIDPCVDLNNCLSLDLVVPACVMDVGGITPPFTLRAGRPGESMTSMRGPFDLAAKPTLSDAAGPFGTPITDSERVKVTPATTGVWLVAYLPAGVVSPDDAAARLRALVERAPVARLGATAHTPA
jgi:DNA/RNA-binding domain of Phe-tRNA-synthetase-like protein